MAQPHGIPLHADDRLASLFRAGQHFHRLRSNFQHFTGSCLEGSKAQIHKIFLNGLFPFDLLLSQSGGVRQPPVNDFIAFASGVTRLKNTQWPR